MTNFPIEQMEPDWLVYVNNTGYGMDSENWQMGYFMYCQIENKRGIELIPNHLYKWDKRKLPPIMGKDTKWVAFDSEMKAHKNIYIEFDSEWEKGRFIGFMIIGDD